MPRDVPGLTTDKTSRMIRIVKSRAIAISGRARRPVELRADTAVAVTSRHANLALPAIVLVAVVVWGLASISVAAPWIYVDELIYSDLAKSIAAGGAPSVRGVASYGYGLGYPLVIAPAWALTRDPGRAYLLARLINSVVMCLAAVPAYLLARRFVSRKSAIVVAALTVAVPSMVYVTTILTEVAFYPAFLFAVLAMQRALEKPSWQRQIVALMAIAVSAATKILAIGLLPAYVVPAFLLSGISSPQPGVLGTVKAGLRSVRVALIAAIAGLALMTVARGLSPLRIFGAYTGAVSNVRWSSLPLAIARHAAVILIYTAVVPVVATGVVVVIGFSRRAEPRARAFAALVAPTVLAMVGGVAVFAVYASRIDFAATGVPLAMPVYERNLFIVTPLLLIGLALWIELGCPTPRIVTRLVSLAAIVLVAIYPWSHVVRHSANPQNLATLPWVITPLSNRLLSAVVTIVALGVLVLWRGVNPTNVRRIWGVVAVWFCFTGLLSFVVFHGTAARASRDGVGVTPSWIDQAVGRRGRVEIIWPEPRGTRFAVPRNRQRVVWASEFYNRSVDGVISLGAKLPFGLPGTLAHLGPGGVLLASSGQPIRADYVLAPCSFSIKAPVVAVDRQIHAVVYRPGGVVTIGGASACDKVKTHAR